MQKFGMTSFHLNDQNLQNVKVAILDNGFADYAAEKNLLPPSTQVVELTEIAPAPTKHGLGMAQIVWALTGKSTAGPSFYLINTNGFSNFKAAVQFVIDKKIDIVLYSQVWPFGGNLDGSGFINDLVTKAVRSGVIWINAAGNYGNMVYNGKIKETRVPTPPSPSSAPAPFLFFRAADFLRFDNKFDEGSATITLSWSDFTSDENYNTKKDLDLLVYDDSGNLVTSSTLIQRGEAPGPGKDPLLSSHAREVATLEDLDKGIYHIKVKMNSNNFVPQDRFRIVIKEEREGTISFLDHTSDGEIMPPADNPFAITVGEAEKISSVGPTADGRPKPDTLIQDARIAFSNGLEFRGSSNAAAIFAGIVTVMKAFNSGVRIEHLRTLCKSAQQPTANASDADLEPLIYDPVTSVPRLGQLMPVGSKVLLHRLTHHYVILTREDPFSLEAPRRANMRRSLDDDILAYDLMRERWLLIPKVMRSSLKTPLVEFRKMALAPGNQGYTHWKTPTPAELNSVVRRLH
ncbi:MAG: hypothetical protein HQK50_06610 [Oligoflexia bacterium]|nr:hypothetical protein [Oligoflexia bacterium]MBF0365224.1 hypothetical protein [Oligoflexia bacterium]